MIAGVAAGLGDYFEVDPVWFRLAFVVSAFLGGAGIILYGAMWLLVPAVQGPVPGQAPLPPRMERVVRRIDRTPGWVGVVLLLLGVLLLANRIVAWRPGIFWGVVLVAIGVLLFRRPSAARSHSPEMPPSPPPPNDAVDPTPVAGSAPAPLESWNEAPTLESPFVATEPESPMALVRARRGRDRSALGWMVMGAVLLALGVAALLDVADAIHITLVQYLALALTVVGLGLLVGAFLGRARWLVVPALLLIPFVLVASLIEVPFAGGTGDLAYRPASFESINPTYHLVAGVLTIDLRNTQLGIQPVAIRATNVAGRILVLVSPETPLEVRARVGSGDVSLFGQNYDGVKVDVRRTFGAASPGSPGVVRLDLETALGQVEVRS
jgi:phage shock protein PspC (stress-responsive transcriptional regulator)